MERTPEHTTRHQSTLRPPVEGLSRSSSETSRRHCCVTVSRANSIIPQLRRDILARIEVLAAEGARLERALEALAEPPVTPPRGPRERLLDLLEDTPIARASMLALASRAPVAQVAAELATLEAAG